MTLKAMATARRNLAQRIGRFLDGLDREKRAPTVWECSCLDDALLLLESESYPAGEAAMMRAEKSDVFGTPDAAAKIAPAAQIRPPGGLGPEGRGLLRVVPPRTAARPRGPAPVAAATAPAPGLRRDLTGDRC
jgi:hypothetical protein